MLFFLVSAFIIFCGLNVYIIYTTQHWDADQSRFVMTKKSKVGLFWFFEILITTVEGTFNALLQSGEFIAIILLLVIVASVSVFFSIFGKMILFIVLIIYFVLLVVYQHKMLYSFIQYLSKKSGKPTENNHDTLLINPYYTKKLGSFVFGTIITIILFLPVIFVAIRWL
ncbi:MAG: hypothetical protein IPM42_05475 [Saprospiraceae bacterium]|nr:hypothetical protein [Saprospiraceae bacterium]